MTRLARLAAGTFAGLVLAFAVYDTAKQRRHAKRRAALAQHHANLRLVKEAA